MRLFATAIFTLLSITSISNAELPVELTESQIKEGGKLLLLTIDAKDGDLYSRTELGRKYYYGDGAPQDYVEAVKWLRKASSGVDGFHGDPFAQCLLGQCYYFGLGVPKDLVKAAKWYREAAEGGLADAQRALGYMYKEGEGVPKDDVKAAKWNRKAAEQGDARAQRDLAIQYHVGKGVPEDYIKSYMWANLAAALGDTLAPGLKDILIEKMTKEQIAEAQKLSSEWFKKIKEQGNLQSINSF